MHGEAGIRGSVSLHRYQLLSTPLSCQQGAGDVHSFVSKKMICKYKCWQEEIMKESGNK